MQASSILMRRDAAELAVPVLDRALANVLDVEPSEGEREQWKESLIQARADLFAVLNAICTLYPDLDNSRDPDPVILQRHQALFERERQEAAESLSASRASEGCIALRAAVALVDRAKEILHAEGVESDVGQINQRLSSARACIQASLDHLLGHSDG